MRSTFIAMLILCCSLGAGCESLNQLVKRPGKSMFGNPDKLAQDADRRKQTELMTNPPASTDALARKAEQQRQTNFPPSNPALNGGQESLLARAAQAERDNQLPAAKSLYEQVLQANPQSFQAHHRLAVLADQQGRFEESQQHYQTALSLAPQNATLLSDIGYSFFTQDRLDEAEYYLQESLRLDPQYDVARNNLAQVYNRRAQQTGSQADYQLAREHLAMASEAGRRTETARQMSGTTPSSEEPKGFPNPFKRRGAKDKALTAQAGKDLQAPDPESNKETEDFIKKFEEMRADAIRKGEYKTSKSFQEANSRDSARSQEVPVNQLNEEISRVENDAKLRRDLALRDSNFPAGRRPARRQPAPQRPESMGSDQGMIEQTSGSNEAGVPRLTPAKPQNPRFPGGRPTNGSTADNSRDWSQDGRDNSAQREQRDWSPNSDSDALANNPTFDQSWQQPQLNTPNQSWPHQSGAPNQFDAAGERWDGNSVMTHNRTSVAGGSYDTRPPQFSDSSSGMPSPGRTSAPAFGGNFAGSGETQSGLVYRPASNQKTMVQAPAGWGNTGVSADRSGGMPTGGNWNGPDDGRNAAAQIALDAGMGEMFPAQTNAQPPVNSRRQGRAPYGPRNSIPNGRERAPNQNSSSAWPSVDPQNQGLQAPAMTPGGMQQGGMGMMAPADYVPRQAGFQAGGYPQGAVPNPNENFGGTRGYRSSGPNQGMGYPNSGGVNRGQRDPGGNSDYGDYQGGGYPAGNSRTATPSNFASPPMYFGR